MEQGTDEWFRERLGKVTASRIADVCSKTKSGWGAGRANYAAQLICERLTGNPSESFSNAAMQWGTDTEPQARNAYEFLTDRTVEQVAFVPHPTIDMCGASPDGLVGNAGLVEIKCPNSATHIKTLSGGSIERKYMLQMQWQMACTGREWCDFVSFDPRLPESMQMHRTRVMRNNNLIAETESIVRDFLAEIEYTIARLKSTYEQKESAA